MGYVSLKICKKTKTKWTESIVYDDINIIIMKYIIQYII